MMYLSLMYKKTSMGMNKIYYNTIIIIIGRLVEKYWFKINRFEIVGFRLYLFSKN